MSNRRRIVYKTRAERERRSTWLKAGVWIFLLIFVFSVAGGVVLIGGLGK
ncbi:MAG TPA: hypothetical protein VGN11_01180 [Candidatus Baltobacteraceae bacterium]|jgi:hypothetical protein|nr:hypothetical protein [Candidatus Baltobacteraceae bacterium]